MRRLLGIACCGLGLAAPAGAAAAGGPVPPLQGGAGVTVPGADVRYVAMSTGRVVLPPGLPTDAERPRSARQPADPPAARTSAVLAPPKPKEFDSA